MHFGNATRTFSKGKCSAYIFQRKMFSTFSKGKCSVHFPLENVQQTKMLESGKMHFCNAYIFYEVRSQMFSITFSKGKCSAKQNVRNAPVKCTHCLCFLLCFVFLLFAKQKTQHFSAFAVPLHFAGAEHFPKENVRVAKMHFAAF